MKIKDLSVIETDAMLDLFDICDRVHNGDTDFKTLRQKIYRIQSKLKPLEPIVKDVIDHSFDIGHWSSNELKPLGLGEMLNREKELKEEIFELYFKEINL